MGSLDDALDDSRSRPALYAGAVAFTLGLVFLGVGALSVAFDTLAGAVGSNSAAILAPTLVGGGLATGLAVGAGVLGDWADERRIGAGLALSYAGVGAVWVVGPTSGLSAAALGPIALYLAGTLVLLATTLESLVVTDASVPSTPAVRVGSSTGGFSDPAVADGGDDDDRLEFLLDDDDDSERL